MEKWKFESEMIPAVQTNEPLSLYEELRKIDIANELKCESCGKTFNNKHSFQAHIRICTKEINFHLKIYDLKKKLFNQRIELSKNIFELKDAELEERISCKPECQIGCKIFHSKHNWQITFSCKFLENLHNFS